MAPDELVPNCVTCRQHFEDNGAVLIAQAQQQRIRSLISGGAIHNTAGRSVGEMVARQMRVFHEEHKPDDN